MSYLHHVCCEDSALFKTLRTPGHCLACSKKSVCLACPPTSRRARAQAGGQRQRRHVRGPQTPRCVAVRVPTCSCFSCFSLSIHPPNPPSWVTQGLSSCLKQSPSHVLGGKSSLPPLSVNHTMFTVLYNKTFGGIFYYQSSII